MKKIILLLLSLVGGFIIFKITLEILPHSLEAFELLALVSGLLAPIITSVYLFSKNTDAENNNKKTKIVSELALLAFIGFVMQKSYFGAHYHDELFNKYIGFTLFLPLFGAIIHFLYNKTYLRTKSSITITCIILSLAIHILNFTLYPLIEGHTEQMYGIILIFGFPIAIVFGIIYAIYFIKVFFNKSDSLG